MIKFDLPRDTYTPIKLVGHFTVHDVLRIGLPTLTLGILVYNPENVVSTFLAVTTGLLLGLGWTVIRPEGQPVDTHLIHFLRQRLEDRTQNTGIEEIREKTAVTDDGTAIAAVKVHPVSLKMQDKSEQRALHSILAELYETVSFPIEIHSRQLPLSLDSYINDLSQGKDTRLRQDYIKYCSEFNKGSNSTTQHYIVIRTHQDKTSHIQSQLHQLRKQHRFLDNLFEKIDPYLPIDTGNPPSKQPQIGELQHRADLVLDTLNRGALETEQLSGLEFQQYIQSFNQQHQIQTSRDSYTITEYRVGRYRKPLFIDEFPSTAKLGWTVDLLNQESTGRVDLIQRIEPRNQSKTVRKLERQIQRIEAEVNSRLGGGLIKDITELQTKREDAEQMLELCAENSQTLVNYSAYLIAHGNTVKQRDHAYTEAQTRLDTLLADTKQPLYRADQAYRTESVLHTDALHEPTLMPSSSAASGFPFATSNRNEGQGIIYGISTEVRSPVLLNKWSWSSYSTAVLGKTGSGKSFFVKTLLLRWQLAYNNTRFIVVDPKNEYGNLIQQLGGNLTEADQSLDFGDTITGIQVPERGREENTDQLIRLIRELYTRTSQDKKKTIVVIDEAHNILREKRGRQALEQFVREARDTYTSVVMISQNASDFTSNIEGRNILKNTEAVFLMRHSEVADDVTDFFQLSQTEKTELQKLKTGTKSSYSQALMRISDRLNTKIRIQATPAEQKTIQQERGGEGR